MGLGIMKHRAKMINARLDIHSKPNDGRSVISAVHDDNQCTLNEENNK